MCIRDSLGNAGRTATSQSAIAGTVNDPLYQSNRYGNMQLDFPVPNGTYQIELHFAETYFSAAGSRVFHVDVEGERDLTNYDIIDEAGGPRTAVVEYLTVAVTDGNLDIDFINVTDNAKISGIAISESDNVNDGGVTQRNR